MKKFFILCFLCIFGKILAQNWTLENCIEYAIAHNISVKQMEISQRAAKTELNSAKMAFLPDLNASAGQNWNFGRTQTQSGLYENQTQSNTSFSVGSQMPIFTGGRMINSVAKAKLDLQAAALNLEKAKDDISLQVTSLFLQVLFQKEILKIANEQFSTTKQQAAQTEILARNGKVPESQLFDIQAQEANDTLSVVQANSNLKLALLDLAQSLELQDFENFDIDAGDFSHIGAEENAESAEIETSRILRRNLCELCVKETPQNIYNQALANRAEVKSAEIDVKSAEKSLKIAQSAYYPTISLSAGIGTNYFYLYQNQGLNKPFSEQMNTNLGEYVGLSLNIPIFNRLSVLNQEKQAKYNIENQKLALENTKKQLFKEIQTAYLNAVSANEKQNAAAKAVASAQEAFRYAKERYESGKSSVFEFSQAQSRLAQAQADEAQAKFDYIFKIKVLEFYRK
ncbi:MAG: TolC family protein [Prevotellaceae bacterium]|nr:TolC family protein [Prevotellaceae bacterium]